MATEIDGFAVFAAMAGHASLFEAAQADATKAARAVVTKQLKVKTLPLDHLRDIRAALGADAFGLIVQGLKDAEVKGLVTRLDKDNPNVKGMSEAERLRHLLALADGTEPVPKPARAARATKSPASSKAGSSVRNPPNTSERTLSSKAMAAKSPRRKATLAD